MSCESHWMRADSFSLIPGASEKSVGHPQGETGTGAVSPSGFQMACLQDAPPLGGLLGQASGSHVCPNVLPSKMLWWLIQDPEEDASCPVNLHVVTQESFNSFLFPSMSYPFQRCGLWPLFHPPPPRCNLDKEMEEAGYPVSQRS